MIKKKVTRKGLEKLQNEADKVIASWMVYREKLTQYVEAFSSGTTPPGEQPPNPPGIPKKPK